MSMLGNAPQMSDEQVQQAQNQQMKDFLSTYNKTTQVYFSPFFILCVKKVSFKKKVHKRRGTIDQWGYFWSESRLFFTYVNIRFASTIVSKTSQLQRWQLKRRSVVASAWESIWSIRLGWHSSLLGETHSEKPV